MTFSVRLYGNETDLIYLCKKIQNRVQKRRGSGCVEILKLGTEGRLSDLQDCV